MNRALVSQENAFADWVISQMTNTMYLANNMREAAYDARNDAVVMLFSPEVEEDVEHLKSTLSARVKEMTIIEGEGQYADDNFPIKVDAQQVRVNRRTNLLLKVHNVETGD